MKKLKSLKQNLKLD